jgi:hypothetical protein
MKYVVAVIPSIIIVFLGICIKYFKAYWLISGYNTMPAEKKKNVDVESLGKAMGNFCFVLGGVMFVFILSLILEQTVLAIIAALLLAAAIIYFIIKSQRFDGNAMKNNGKMKKSTKVIVGIIAAFLVLVFLGVGILLYKSNQPIIYNISEDNIQIVSLYGETINFSDINNFYISDQIPDITSRTNGSAVGNMLKGYFKVDQIGNAKLFINTQVPSFIFIETDNKTIILNGQDEASTRELFTKLEKMIQ